MSQQGITIISVGVDDLGDIIDLMQLEFNSKLIEDLSAEFTGNAAQVTYVPANGKTFYHIKSQLKPVTNTVASGATGAGTTTVSRRADVELTMNSVLIDVLTHNFAQTWGSAAAAGASAQGNGGRAGQYESNSSESLEGDGIKSVVLTSTNNSGTYRVHMKGAIMDTGVLPSA